MGATAGQRSPSCLSLWALFFLFDGILLFLYIPRIVRRFHIKDQLFGPFELRSCYVPLRLQERTDGDRRTSKTIATNLT